MKQRTITNEQQLYQASQDLLKLTTCLPVVISVTEGTKLRKDTQNARYWADMQNFMDQISDIIEAGAEQSGYSEIELRRLIAAELAQNGEIEQAAIVLTKSKDAVHDILKQRCGIPTSTRLGTKAFAKFDGIREQIMSEVIGNIKGFLNL